MSGPAVVTASGCVLAHATVEASAQVEAVPQRPPKVALGVGVTAGPPEPELRGYIVLSWGDVRYRPVHSPHVEVEAKLGEVIRFVDLSPSDAKKLVSAGRIRLHRARGGT